MQTTEKHFSSVSGDSTSSGVVWGAIFAGAIAAAALSLILLVLGVGLGFSTVSPWPNSGISTTTLGVATIVWLIVTQLLASGIGGYLAGRLRSKWTAVHTHEVYFRDTAHGLLAWAVASLIVAALIGTVMGKTLSAVGSAASSLTGTTVDIAGAAATDLSSSNFSHKVGRKDKNNSDIESVKKYLIGTLFRPNPTSESNLSSNTDTHAEAEQVLLNSIRSSSLPEEDSQYLAQLIAKRTGLSVEESQKRLNETFNRLQTSVANIEKNARETADKARKATANSALWMFIALLSGAFIASLSATLGGRRRDCNGAVRI